ncbi:hypothetical protein BDW62DRAFT_192798 [Aspergillus aurantiobrunneus]
MQKSREDLGLVYQPGCRERRQASPSQGAGKCKGQELSPNTTTLQTNAWEQGLAIFSVFEVGMMRSLRFGSGLVVARLPNGTWSAPSAIATGKLTAKGQFGVEFTDFVYVLNTDAAVDKFAQATSFTLGQDVSIAVGPFGRSAELAGDAYEADIFAYCKTRAVFGGSTLEGATIGERVDANRKMYQEIVTPMQLLRGEVTLPPETYSFMKILHSTWLRAVARSSSVPKEFKTAKKVPQQSVATELPCESPESPLPVISPVTTPGTSPGTSPVTGSSGKEDGRFYGRRFTSPHQITIQVTDYSGVELPPSLTSDPEPERHSSDIGPDSAPTRCPAVLRPGRRSWSVSTSASWSRHDPLHL